MRRQRHRHPGGFWAGPELATRGGMPVGKECDDWVGTQTVRALVRRNAMRPTGDRFSGTTFYSEVELMPGTTQDTAVLLDVKCGACECVIDALGCGCNPPDA